MKRILMSACVLAAFTSTYAQQIPTANGNGSNSGNYWSRSGNYQSNSTNIFGTRWNSPIYFITGGLTQQTYRMKLNGDFGTGTQYAINGFSSGVNTSGYLGLGYNLQGLWSQNPSPTGAAKGPFSLLHLNGRDGAFVQEGGYRPWMKTGITFTDNQDMSYFGLRTILPDLTETVLSWSEIQSNVVPPGQDDLVFRMTAGTANNADANIIGNFQSTTDLDGLHVARFTGFGHFALGNTFGTTQSGSNYVRPSSHFHMSHHAYNLFDRQWGFMQITYRDLTGETADDGLRFGIDRVATSPHGFLRWQENSAFIFQTDWDNIEGGIENGERMRITSISENNVVDPFNANSQNITRVAMSHLGSSPITSPRSLLHLGYNTGIIGTATSSDGWRSWMDIGTFTSNGTDNMYSGLKEEGPDRYDAVINWGDNQVAGTGTPANGSDYLRFIFTSTNSAVSGQGDPVSQSFDGLEVARMDPKQASTLTNNYGMVGIGNFAANNPNSPAPIDAKLDIDGDLRIREVTQDNTLTQVLVIDPNDFNRVHYADISIPSGSGFVDCADNSGAANLTTDSKVNLNNNDLFFENNDQFGTNHTGFGYDCGSILPAKVSVEQVHPGTVAESSTAISGINSDVTTGVFKTYTGVYGEATEMQNINLRPVMIGGDFTAANGALNYGVRSTIINSPQAAESNFGFYSLIDDDNSTINIGSYNSARNSVQNIGVQGEAHAYLSLQTQYGYGGRFTSYGHDIENIGVYGSTATTSTYGLQNYGVKGIAGSAVNNYSIYGEVPAIQFGTNFYAGYFAGDVVVTGNLTVVSDSNFKEEIVSLDDRADSLLMLVKPYSYKYKQTGNAERLRLNKDTKYGVLAQQVEPYFPNMVSEVTHPAELDSLGNIINPSFTYKSVDLTQLIPVLIHDAQRKSEVIDKQEEETGFLTKKLEESNAQLESVNDRLTQLENCLSNLLPALCQANAMAVESTPEEVKQQLSSIIDVELTNGNNIILNQNVPNPFAERTVITYSIPGTVGKAQIHFYDGTGKLINTVDITERGEGQLNVYANDLSSGVYTYSLVADGQIVATKRMVKN